MGHDLVCDAVLLGSPSRARDEAWRRLRPLVAGRFVNGFFAQDAFLCRGNKEVYGVGPGRGGNLRTWS